MKNKKLLTALYIILMLLPLIDQKLLLHPLLFLFLLFRSLCRFLCRLGIRFLLGFLNRLLFLCHLATLLSLFFPHDARKHFTYTICDVCCLCRDVCVLHPHRADHGDRAGISAVHAVP